MELYRLAYAVCFLFMTFYVIEMKDKYDERWTICNISTIQSTQSNCSERAVKMSNSEKTPVADQKTTKNGQKKDGLHQNTARKSICKQAVNYIGALLQTWINTAAAGIWGLRCF